MPIIGMENMMLKFSMLGAGVEGPFQAAALDAAGEALKEQIVDEIKKQGLWRTGENFAAGLKVVRK